MNRRPGSTGPGEMGRGWNITEVPDVEIEIKAWRLMKKDGLIFATGNLQKTLEGGDFKSPPPGQLIISVMALMNSSTLHS
ncbi:MAG: hypothetical protein HFH84_17280 [Lachnospiraceae bacterium]|nr:hypothetical protein [Lachnospiraceae bacterium]